MNAPDSRSRGGSSEFISQTGRTLLNVREMLLRGDFQPGERISELPMVARLGVSRTPIRLALDRLANEGLLECSPSGGFVVRSFTVSDIWDAIEMRGVLEGTAARLAAERLTHEDELTGIRRCMSEMDAYLGPASNIDSFARYLDLNDAFHASVVDLAKSPMLRRTLDQVMLLPFAQPSAMVFARSKLPAEEQKIGGRPDITQELFAIGQEHHRVILDAISHRQGARADAAAREHSGLSRRVLELALQDRNILNCVPGGSLIRLTESDRTAGV
jgi:GntR family transcriptional regulator, vanillate catabolism transcriptional regulator